MILASRGSDGREDRAPGDTAFLSSGSFSLTWEKWVSFGGPRYGYICEPPLNELDSHDYRATFRNAIYVLQKMRTEMLLSEI